MRLVLTSLLNPLSTRRGKRLTEHYAAGDLKKRARRKSTAFKTMRHSFGKVGCNRDMPSAFPKTSTLLKDYAKYGRADLRGNDNGKDNEPRATRSNEGFEISHRFPPVSLALSDKFRPSHKRHSLWVARTICRELC
jgi:hypothetical protein